MSDEPSFNIDIEPDDEGLVRLQKLLARHGVASRRRCEELMLAGEVTVDGEVVTRLGTKVDPRTAVVHVSGKRLPPLSEHVYLVLHKPVGVQASAVGGVPVENVATIAGDLLAVNDLSRARPRLRILAGHSAHAHDSLVGAPDEN